MEQPITKADILPPVHLWLADQTQSSIPAWLTSPTVALLGLIASAISVLQALISTTKWFMKRTDKRSTRRRLTVSVGICIIASIVVLAPLTWQMMAREDVKAGSNPLWVAELYPFCIFLPLILSAMCYFLVDSFKWKGRLPIAPFVLTIGCLALSTGFYDAFHVTIWERCLVTATPGFTVAMLVATYLANLLPRAESHDAKAPKPPSATEKVA
jgi:hypothetical protein